LIWLRWAVQSPLTIRLKRRMVDFKNLLLGNTVINQHVERGMIFSPFFRCSIHMTWYHFQTIHRHRGPKAMKAQDIKIREDNIAAHSSKINGSGWRFSAVSLFSCFTQIEGQIWYCIAFFFFAELGFQKRRWVTLPAVHSFLAPHSKTSIRKSRR